MKAIEFFCGIGGFAAAFDGQVCLAIDQDRFALETYRLNYAHPTMAKTVGSVSSEFLARIDADLWWASPPCQPFTTKGAQRFLQDPRSQPLQHLLAHLAKVRPRHFAMENVIGFADSPGEDLVRQTLHTSGYRHVQTFRLCPTQWGIPNRRPRFYLVASQTPLGPMLEPDHNAVRSLAAYLEDGQSPMVVPGVWLDKYIAAMDVLRPQAGHPVAQTFTSGYGKSPVRCGSYIETANGLVRFFSPKEIAALLGFPKTLRFPASSSPRQAWKRLGNSLSIAAVARVLTVFPRSRA